MTTSATAYDVVVIGGGPAGVSAALTAASAGVSVAIVEQEKLGGMCGNASCIPTEILLDAANTALSTAGLSAAGVLADPGKLNLPALVRRKRALVSAIGNGVAERLDSAGVTHILGHASFIDTHTIAIDQKHRVRAGAVILATGARWATPHLNNITLPNIVTPDVVQEYTQVPESALVIGGRHKGLADFAVEYAYLLAAMGADTILVTESERLVAGLDHQLQSYVVDSLETIGCSTRLDSELTLTADGQMRLTGGGEALQPEVIVLADVREPSLDGLNAGAAGLNPAVPVAVDEFYATNVPHIYAVGDLIGGSSLTTSAFRSGQRAGANAAGNRTAQPAVFEPVVLHLHTEVAFAGLDEHAAAQKYKEVTVGFLDMTNEAGNLIQGAIPGAVKVIATPADGAIVGVHAVGQGAAQIVEAAAALVHNGVTVQTLTTTPVWHPSPLESLAAAANQIRTT